MTSIDSERERVARIARLMLDGQIAPRDGAGEISAPVDPAGGPAHLTPEQQDLYMEFYGWLDVWDDSEIWRRAVELPADLVASYEEELLNAARELITRLDADSE